MTESDSAASPVHEQPFLPFSSHIDWRVWFGIVISIFWLLMLAIYISAQVGWTNIGDTPVEQLGGFLEGAFAPLAFLWFVLAFFSQQKELSQNTTAIKMQYIEIQRSAEQAVIQSEAIRATERHARREAFLLIAESVRYQLGAIIGFLYLSSQGTTGGGRVSNERLAQLWGRLGQNDPEVFSRAMLELHFQSTPAYAYKLYFGTAIRQRHSENFVFHFERLLQAAEECDDEGMIRDAVLGSGHGYVYNHIIDCRDHPPEGFTPGVYDFDPDTPD